MLGTDRAHGDVRNRYAVARFVSPKICPSLHNEVHFFEFGSARIVCEIHIGLLSDQEEFDSNDVISERVVFFAGELFDLAVESVAERTAIHDPVRAKVL